MSATQKKKENRALFVSMQFEYLGVTKRIMQKYLKKLGVAI